MYIKFSLDDAERGLPGGEYCGSFKWRGRYDDVYWELYDMLVDLVEDLPLEMLVVVDTPVRMRFVVDYDPLSIGKTMKVIGKRMIKEMKKGVLRGQLRPPAHFRKSRTD